MAKRSTAFKPTWIPCEGLAKAFTLGGGKGTLYWKGGEGWWAQRPGMVRIEGPFRWSKQAREWAEEPARIAHEKRVMEAAAKRDRRTEQAEQIKANTWGNLPPSERKLKPGQIWSMKAPGFQDHQILILDLRKQSVLALVRSGDRPWGRCPKDVRSNYAIIRLYRYSGEGRIPQMRIP